MLNILLKKIKNKLLSMEYEKTAVLYYVASVVNMTSSYNTWKWMKHLNRVRDLLFIIYLLEKNIGS